MQTFTPLDSRPGNRAACLTALFLILCFGIAIRVIHWTPSPDGDEARYINHAIALAHGQKPEFFDPLVAVRLPYICFLALWGGIFGFTTTSMEASGLFTYVWVAGAIWYLAYRLHGITASLIATFLFTIMPLHVRLSTHALSDDLGLALALSSAAIWFKVSEKPLRVALPAILLSGCIAGLATAIRQPFFLLGLIFPLGMIAKGDKVGKAVIYTAVFGVGALCYFACESLAFWLLMGDPAFRVAVDVTKSAMVGHPFTLVPRPPRSVLQKLFQFRAYYASLLPSGAFGIVPVLLIVAIADRLSVKDKDSHPWIIWCIVLAAYHFWGTTSLKAWNPPPVVARYLLPVMSVGCILVARSAAGVHTRYRFSMATTLVAGLCLCAVSWWVVVYAGRPNCTAEFVHYVAERAEVNPRRTGYPESIKRFFLPLDQWYLLKDFRMIPDEELRNIEKASLADIDAIIVPAETFYRYSHVGVLDAFERTASCWAVEEVVGSKWPPYLRITGKASDRVIGYIFRLKSTGPCVHDQKWRYAPHTSAPSPVSE